MSFRNSREKSKDSAVNHDGEMSKTKIALHEISKNKGIRSSKMRF